MMRIAFLGLGVMGSGMAGRLVGAGFPVAVWNRSPTRADALVRQGATLATSPGAAAADADVVIGMVADDRASREIWAGASGALGSMRRGAIAIECSTLTPAWVVELGGLAADRGVALLDAPVTGSRTHAAGGELLFLVGGDGTVLERVRPVLGPMSRDVVHLGPSGAGARMKLVNNFVCGVQAAALGEALAFAEAGGLDAAAAMSVLANGAPGSPLVKGVSTRMASRDYAVNFRLALMRKDLAYAVDDAATLGLPLTTGSNARDLFQRGIDAGWADADFAAVIEVARVK
jgi:3-hydroxyisobutyrate dehydrogenase